ncbi:MAG TPA: class I SAM-dependent methyltransferase [Candidatus Angelobacter sp.]|nr:class I SAM-dependent methyltransferase [Candidatus Angelobacter sp.]
MTSLKKLQRNWEGLARMDPLWAICVDPKRRGNQWNREDLLTAGRTEIRRVMEYLRSLGLVPDAGGAVLDFGCGAGRLTRALADYFGECWGVDISPAMIALAKEFNQDRAACHFQLNEKDDLSGFTGGKFGFIYSSIVLQHIPRIYAERYLCEFIRVLRPGGVLVFQIPEREIASIITKLKHRIGLRGVFSRLPGMKTVAPFHMQMFCFPESEIRELFKTQPVYLRDVKLTNSCTGGFNGNLQFLDLEPQAGFISKQYCVIKTGL